MHILLTNDDGIEAEGLRAFADLVREQPNVTRVSMVAPVDGRSACGHSVNTYSPIRLQEVAPEEFAIDGWPADCVRIAILHLGLKPDWVFSGINHGGNLGVDIIMSGTCSAAREAAWLGYPSIAFSQYRNPNLIVPWQTSALRAWSVASQIMTKEPYPSIASNQSADENAKSPLSGFWNVNLPSIDPSLELPQLAVCSPDPSPHRFHWELTDDGLLYRSSYQSRPRIPDHDIECCFKGSPTVSYCNTLSFL